MLLIRLCRVKEVLVKIHKNLENSVLLSEIQQPRQEVAYHKNRLLYTGHMKILTD